MVDVGTLLDPAVLAGVGAAVVTSAYFYAMAPTPLRTPVDLKEQSAVTDSGSRISTLCRDGKLQEYVFDDAKTLYECFRRGVKLSGDKSCLGARTGMGVPEI